MLFVGILIALLIGKLMPHDPNNKHNEIFDHLIAVLITFIVWEGNLRIDEKLNQRIPWITRPGYRLSVQFVIALVFSALGVYIPMKLFNSLVCIIPPEREMILNFMSLGVGLVVSVIILTFEIGSQFFRNWKESLVQIEHYKTENIRAQLQNLKNQLNPHFLFNNMSVLSSLVYSDQDKAVNFIDQLSKVYRYLLDNRNNELVDLETELNFIHSYIYLLQIRFDKNLQFEMDIPKENMSLLLPPMSLQMLIENAIKHNEVSREQPLLIKIVVEEQKLVVSNNLQKRSVNETSSKTGIQNIKDRYRFFTEKLVEVIESVGLFTVKLPLLTGK